MENILKISIVTPTYNRANLLLKLYESLLANQNREVQIEWLVMDDGSEDKTREIVENWKQENKIAIQYFYQKNQGKMAAINKLVEQAMRRYYYRM